MNNVIRIFLLVFGNASALLLALLALETTVTNLVGWFLFATGIAYGAGGAISLWRDQILDKQACPETGHRSSWWLLPGFLASFFIPPVEFLYLPAILPRGSGTELGGLMLILL